MNRPTTRVGAIPQKICSRANSPTSGRPPVALTSLFCVLCALCG